MIQDALSKQIFKNLSSLGLSPPINNTHKDYCFRDTLKQCLLESIGDSKITIESGNQVKIEIKTEEFKTALFSDFHFGYTRISEQVKNVTNLLNSDSQVSWIITTAYYACYFMAVEISKLYGTFIINFSEEELASILSSSENPNSFTIKQESNNSFQISVRQSLYTNNLDLQLIKEASRPHQIVWLNLSKLLNRLTVDDKLLHHKNLLTDICDGNNKRWKLPSAIRNEWNYTYANLYSTQGTELGATFLSIIRRSDSAMGWANHRKLPPDEKNITASIAYLYHCLFETITRVHSRFYQS